VRVLETLVLQLRATSATAEAALAEDSANRPTGVGVRMQRTYGCYTNRYEVVHWSRGGERLRGSESEAGAGIEPANKGLQAARPASPTHIPSHHAPLRCTSERGAEG